MTSKPSPVAAPVAVLCHARADLVAASDMIHAALANRDAARRLILGASSDGQGQADGALISIEERVLELQDVRRLVDADSLCVEAALDALVHQHTGDHVMVVQRDRSPKPSSRMTMIESPGRALSVRALLCWTIRAQRRAFAHLYRQAGVRLLWMTSVRAGRHGRLSSAWRRWCLSLHPRVLRSAIAPLLGALHRAFAKWILLGALRRHLGLYHQSRRLALARRGLAGFAAGRLASGRMLHLRRQSDGQRRLLAWFKWRGHAMVRRAAQMIRRGAEGHRLLRAWRAWRTQAATWLGCSWLNKARLKRALVHGDKTHLAHAVRLWRHSAQGVLEKAAARWRDRARARPFRRWKGTWLHLALMRPAVLAARSRLLRASMNAWCTSSSHASYAHEGGVRAAQQWKERARARPFQLWAGQQRLASLLRKMRQERTIVTLTWAHGHWLALTRRAMMSLRRRQLALHRWVGNACALAMQCWRANLNEAVNIHLAVAVWRHNRYSAAWRAWTSPASPAALMQAGATAWMKMSLTAAMRLLQTHAGYRVRAVALATRSVVRGIAEALGAFWQWRRRSQREQTAACAAALQVQLLTAQQTLSAFETWAALPERMRPLRRAVLWWAHQAALSAIAAWEAHAARGAKIRSTLWAVTHRHEAAAFRQWSASWHEGIKRGASMRRSLFSWSRAAIVRAIMTWRRRRDSMEPRGRALLAWRSRSVAAAVRVWIDVAAMHRTRLQTLKRGVAHWTLQRRARAFRSLHADQVTRRSMFVLARRAGAALQHRELRGALTTWCACCERGASALKKLSLAAQEWKRLALSCHFLTWQLLAFFWRLGTTRSQRSWSATLEQADIQFAKLGSMPPSNVGRVGLAWQSKISFRHGGAWGAWGVGRIHVASGRVFTPFAIHHRLHQAYLRALHAWMVQHQHVARPTEVLRRKWRGALFGATAHWAVVARVAKAESQRRRNALLRWSGNALALAFVRWLTAIARATLTRRSLGMWRQRVLSSALNSWRGVMAPDPSVLMMTKAATAWSKRALASWWRGWWRFTDSRMGTRAMLVRSLQRNLVHAVDSWIGYSELLERVRAESVVSAHHAKSVGWRRWCRSLRLADLHEADRATLRGRQGRIRSALHFWTSYALRRRRRHDALRTWHAQVLGVVLPRWSAETRGLRARRDRVVRLRHERTIASLTRSMRTWCAVVDSIKEKSKQIWLLQQLSEQVREEISFSKTVLHRWELKQWRSTDDGRADGQVESPSKHTSPKASENISPVNGTSNPFKKFVGRGAPSTPAWWTDEIEADATGSLGDLRFM